MIREEIVRSAVTPKNKMEPTSATNISDNPPLKRQKTARDAGLDFTKGALVLLMVLYHWLNYFVSDQGFDYYRYIRFITPSFIFLAGFLVTNLLATRAGQNSSSLSARLFIRSGKLLALYTVLNLGVAWIEGGGSNRTLGLGFGAFIETVPEIYLTGAGASFVVLLPISYTLMLSALFQKTQNLPCLYHPVPMVFAFLIVSGLVLSGIRSDMLELISFGLLGLIIGYYVAQRRDHLCQLWPWLVVGYVLHLAALTFWGVPYMLQLVSVCLNLSLVYCLGHIVRPPSATARLMLLLGQYTLLGYVGQIAILQILVVVFRLMDLGPLEAPLAFVAALLLTVTTIAVTDLLRNRLQLVNSLYRLIFA